MYKTTKPCYTIFYTTYSLAKSFAYIRKEIGTVRKEAKRLSNKQDTNAQVQEQTPHAPPEQGKRKRRKIALDLVPFGSDTDEMQSVTGKNKLPENVTHRILLLDVFAIAWPSLVELLLAQLTSMADMMMVGRLGAWATASVGLTTQPKMLLSTMFMAMNVGVMTMVARNKGAGKPDRARSVLRQGLFINVILGLIFSIVGYIFAEPLVQFMGAAEEATLVGGTIYLRIQMAGFLSMALTSTITSALRGAGDSRTAMIYNTTANIVNVIFNYLLIYGNLGFPRLELAGASIATVLGQIVALVMALYVVLRKDQYVRLELKKIFQFNFGDIKDILRVGIPAMIEQCFMRTGMIIFAKTVASLGTVLLATHTICMNIQSLTFMNGQAFAVPATSLVGQSLGKKRTDMAVHYSKTTRRIGMCTALFIAIIIFFFSEQLVGLYTDDLEVIRMGGMILKMVALIQPLQASQFILAGCLRGAGDTQYTAFVTFVTVLLVRPLFAIFAVNVLNWSLWGAWAALVADQLIRTLLVWLRYNSGKWRTALSDNKGKSHHLFSR